MKNLEAVIPHLSVRPTIAELRHLEIGDVVLETVKVAKKDLHQMMTYRGCAYEQDFTTATKIGFVVSDQGAEQAEAILSHASAA